MNTKHKHYDAIVGWANGEAIQYFDVYETQWFDVTGDPAWHSNCQYRIKPKPKYPTTGLKTNEMLELWNLADNAYQGCEIVANAAIRHAIDSGQVIIAPKGE